MPAKNYFFLGSFFETHFWERACQYSVGAFLGAGVLAWSGLVLPFFLCAFGILRPTPSFERGQVLLLPLLLLLLLLVAAATFAALAAAVVAVAAPVAPAVAVGAAAVAAAAVAPALETTQRRVAWPLCKEDYAQVENCKDPALFFKQFRGRIFGF